MTSETKIRDDYAVAVSEGSVCKITLNVQEDSVAAQGQELDFASPDGTTELATRRGLRGWHSPPDDSMLRYPLGSAETRRNEMKWRPSLRYAPARQRGVRPRNATGRDDRFVASIPPAVEAPIWYRGAGRTDSFAEDGYIG